MFQEATRGFQATGDEANEAISRMCLAYLELYVRDFEAAYIVAASVLEKVRAIGDLYRSIGARMVLGFAALGLGRRSEAREAFAESLDLVLAGTRDPMPSGNAHRNRARSGHGGRAIGRAAPGRSQQAGRGQHPQPAIPSARAISRAAADRHPRRRGICERAGTGRRHGYRRRNRRGANARQPGEPRSGCRGLKGRNAKRFDAIRAWPTWVGKDEHARVVRSGCSPSRDRLRSRQGVLVPPRHLAHDWRTVGPALHSMSGGERLLTGSSSRDCSPGEPLTMCLRRNRFDPLRTSRGRPLQPGRQEWARSDCSRLRSVQPRLWESQLAERLPTGQHRHLGIRTTTHSSMLAGVPLTGKLPRA